jgi:1-acyl-sn-glycerol-3-phosphate acyltransferase
MSDTPKFVPGSPERPRFYEFARVIIKIFTPLLYNLKIEGLENVPRTGPILIASNHLSFWDIVSVATYVPRMLHFMAKIEHSQRSFSNWLFTKLEAFFVRRGEGDMDAIRNSLAVLKADQALFIYPEGHRTEDHAMIKAHDGFALIAFKGNVSVLPVATWGSEKVLKKGRIGPWRPTIHIRYGKPITFTPSGKRYTREELEQATTETMKAIAAMLPPEYRGFYADDQKSEEVSAGVASK